MNPVIILGGGGQASVVADAIETRGVRTILGVVTNDSSPPDLGYPILGNDDDLLFLLKKYGVFELLMAVGDGRVRKQIYCKISKCLNDIRYATIVHPRANVASKVLMGEGSFVAIGATVGVGSDIGAHSLINTNASVDHGCKLEAFVSIAPNVALGGGVYIG